MVATPRLAIACPPDPRWACPPRRAYAHSRLLISPFRFVTSDFQFPPASALSTLNCELSTFSVTPVECVLAGGYNSISPEMNTYEKRWGGPLVGPAMSKKNRARGGEQSCGQCHRARLHRPTGARLRVLKDAATTSDDEDFPRPGHGVGGELRVGELRVLAFKVGFDHPTGGRAGFSNVNRNLVLDHAGQRFAERRPAHGRDAIGDRRAHQHRGIARQLDAHLVTRFAQRRGPHEWEIGARRVFRAHQSDQQEFLGFAGTRGRGRKGHRACGNGAGADVSGILQEFAACCALLAWHGDLLPACYGLAPGARAHGTRVW